MNQLQASSNLIEIAKCLYLRDDEFRPKSFQFNMQY